MAYQMYNGGYKPYQAAFGTQTGNQNNANNSVSLPGGTTSYKPGLFGDLRQPYEAWKGSKLPKTTAQFEKFKPFLGWNFGQLLKNAYTWDEPRLNAALSQMSQNALQSQKQASDALLSRAAATGTTYSGQTQDLMREQSDKLAQQRGEQEMKLREHAVATNRGDLERALQLGGNYANKRQLINFQKELAKQGAYAPPDTAMEASPGGIYG